MSAQTTSQATEARWSGRTVASPVLVVVLLLLLAGGFFSLSREGGYVVSAFVMALMLVLLATFLFARVTVSRDGVEIFLGPLGLPRLVHPMAYIKTARPIRINPWWHGWGYRLVRGGWALIVHGGEAVELEMNTGRRFVFTVEHAEEAAAAINQMIAEEGSASYV